MTNDPLEQRPRLRLLEAILLEPGEGGSICLRDPTGESEATLVVSRPVLWLISHFDGTREITEVQAEVCRATGEIVPRAKIEGLLEELEAASFLDSAAYRERKREAEETFLRAPARPAAFAGRAYPAEPDKLADWIDRLLDARPGPGGPPARGLVAPHIDPARGAEAYGSAYGAVRDSQAMRVVVLGISHHASPTPYVLLDKPYETPLGACEVDGAFIRALSEGLPFDPRRDAILHRKEHSVEFQTVFLRRALTGWEDRKIVPILCCEPWLPPGAEGDLPYPVAWRDAFSQRLASLIDADTLIVAGVDFAHVGRRFGDGPPPVDARRSSVEAADREMMDSIASGDLVGFRGAFERSGNSRRVCGYPALLTLMEAIPGATGEALDYGQAIDASVDSLVSFGALVLR